MSVGEVFNCVQIVCLCALCALIVGLGPCVLRFVGFCDICVIFVELDSVFNSKWLELSVVIIRTCVSV